jgi:hypothetical protein
VKGSDNSNGFQYRRAGQIVFEWLGRQKFFKHKIRALWFETHFNVFDRSKHLNRLRWDGQTGWGPRFSSWQKYYQTCSLLKFNAYQWLKCVENILAAWPAVDATRKLTIRYENLITRPHETIEQILSFLGLKAHNGFYRRIPELKKGNFNKWQREFDAQQLEEIKDLITSMLVELGYESHSEWLPQ